MLVTIGHSNHSLAAFLDLLQSHGVNLIADIRRIPKSSRHPHFSRDALDAALAAAGIGYRHFEALGGMRQPQPKSPNGAWREAAFQGYADHMDTPAFQQALSAVIALSRERTVAAMCAEADPSQCHRQILADAMVARGVDVIHLLGSSGGFRSHSLTAHARVDEESGRVTYPSLLDNAGE